MGSQIRKSQVNTKQADGVMQIVQKKEKYIFKENIPVVIYCLPMYNNSIVILNKQNMFEGHYFITHYNQQGNVLKRHSLSNSPLHYFEAPSDKQIIWIQTKNNTLFQWNLSTQSLTKVSLNIKIDQAEIYELFYFAETKLICISLIGNYANPFFKLIYFQYPLTTQSKPIHQYQNNNICNHQYAVRKANNSSKIIWYKYTTENIENFYFKAYQLDFIEHNNKLKGKLKSKEVLNPFYNQKQYKIVIKSIWQINYGHFFIVMHKNQLNPQISGNKQSDYTFVYEQEKNKLRPTDFTLFDKNIKYELTKIYSFGMFTMIRSFHYINNEPIQTPIFYINNSIESIVAKDSWKCNSSQHFTTIGYKQNSIFSCIYSKLNSTSIQTKQIAFEMNPKISIAWMLTNLIEQCPYDLLRQTIKVSNHQNINIED